MSWTLKSDIVARKVCALLNMMGRLEYRACVPATAPGFEPKLWSKSSLSAGYISRASAKLPLVGTVGPWRPASSNDYFRELRGADKEADLLEGDLIFGTAEVARVIRKF